MNRTNKTIPLAELIKKITQDPTYYPQWSTHIVRKAWYALFPHTQSTVKKIFIEKKILYIKIDSRILRNELRTQKATLLATLQAKIATLGGEPKIIDAISFL